MALTLILGFILSLRVIALGMFFSKLNLCSKSSPTCLSFGWIVLEGEILI